MTNHDYHRSFWLTLGALTLLRLFFVQCFELSPDEAYYWTWSRHLDWAYYDQGPLVALVIRGFTRLAGRISESSVRLGAVTLSFLSSWLFFNTVERIFQNSRTAWYAFLGMQTALLFSAGAILMMHDSVMIFAWIAGLYFFYRALEESWRPGFVLGGLALGLGALAKYSMAFFVPCLLLYLFLAPSGGGRFRRFFNPWLAASALVTLLLVSPLLAWNASHHWASFLHIGNLGGWQKSWTFSYKTAGDFLGGQLGVLSPLLGAFVLAAPVWALGERRHSEDWPKRLYLFCFSFPILLYFFIQSLHKPVYANWTAPAYPAALALAGAWFVSKKNFGAARTWARASLWLAAAVTLAVHLEVGWNIFPLSGHAAASLDRVRGWKQTGEAVNRQWQAMRPALGTPPFLAARRYQIASELAFYVPGHPEIYLVTEQSPIQNQYAFWNRPETVRGRDALLVCEDAWELDEIRRYFSRLDPLPPLVIKNHGRVVREYQLAWGRRFLAPAER